MELTSAIDESITKAWIPHLLNHTYVTLIPKVDKPANFDEYRPISLCNLCYKIITKLVANRIKLTLGRHISKEQFAFLQNRQIADAVGVAQECIHSIKDKKMSAFILKLNLQKAYDCVDWDYLRFILIQIGLSVEMVKWIFACYSTASFAVLINGSPSDFFKGNRGLRHGCPISPYLFILAMEGFSQLIHKARRQGFLSGIHVARSLFITHLFFVDDVLLFGRGSRAEWKQYHCILNIFCDAFGLCINGSKSSFLY